MSEGRQENEPKREAPSVHDNHLLSYTVDCEERRVTLRTGYFDREPHEYTEIVFSDVAAYHFEGDTFGTILIDVVEAPLAEIAASYEELFVRGKSYGWPGVDHDGERDLLDQLQAQGVRGYLIHSSCGMDGFVMSRTLELRPSS